METELIKNKAWGLSSQIDIEGADIDLIKNVHYVKNYIIDLCDSIGMKRYGETWIERFGNEPHLFGITVLQAIETSCITGHFSEADGRCFIDVFSCADYSPEKVLKFTIQYFRASGGQISIANYRGIKDSNKDSSKIIYYNKKVK